MLSAQLNNDGIRFYELSGINNCTDMQHIIQSALMVGHRI